MISCLEEPINILLLSIKFKTEANQKIRQIRPVSTYYEFPKYYDHDRSLIHAGMFDVKRTYCLSKLNTMQLHSNANPE